MTTTQNDPPPATSTESNRKSRGPGVPTINLEKAVGLMKTVWEKEKRNAAPAVSLLTHWDYKPKSSGGFLAIASLKRFGLLDEAGSGQSRSLKLSSRALELLRHETTDPAEFQRLIKEAALRPKLHLEMWNKYGAEMPSDQTMENHLVFDHHFSEEGARGFLKEYKETIQFAKLTAGDTVSEIPSNDDANNQKQEQTPPHIPHPAKPLAFQPVSSTVGGSPPVTATLIDIPVPLPSGQLAYYRVPASMQETDFTFYQAVLTAYKPGLVKGSRTYPARAMWKNKDHDKEIMIEGVMGYSKTGDTWYASGDGTGIPEFELEFLDDASAKPSTDGIRTRTRNPA